MTNQEFIDSFRQDQKQENWWYRFHPITKMIFCLALGFMSLFVFKWQVGLVIFLIASVIAMTTPIYKKYFATIGIMFVVGCLFTVIVRLYVHLGDPGPAAFYLFGKAVPMAALISCLDLIFMIEGFLGIFLVFFMTTEMRDLCYCLEQKGMYDYFYSIYVDFSSRSQLYSREKSWAWSFWSLGSYDYRLGISFTIIWNPLF